MKERSISYLGTFVNSPEGTSSYKLMIKHIRQVVKGGRFLKMFRGNSRHVKYVDSKTGKVWKWYSGCSVKKGATHFDCYLISKGNNYPMFFRFKLDPYKW